MIIYLSILFDLFNGPVYKLKVEFRNQFSYNISQQQRKRNLE